jgi:hypothetical protein
VIGETWSYKLAANEQVNSATDPTVFARDKYSFWAPLDAKHLQAMARLARTEDFEYLSPFWPTCFFAYADYTAGDENVPARRAMQTVNRMAATNVVQGRLSSTGEAYSAEARRHP